MGDGPTDSAQEYVLRAPGPEHSFTNYFLGMFPGGEPGLAKKKSADWHLEREQETDPSRSMLEANRARPWRLLDKPGSVSHRGIPEGGLSGTASSAGYFVLMKEGDGFTAIPINEFYSFRQTQKFKVNTLEEAERQMESKHQIVFPARLAALVAQADENDGADGNEAASGSEREEEEDDDDLLSRRRGGPAGGPGQAGQPKSEGDEGMDVAVDKDGKGEDWEHEEERADDDVDMGEDGDDAEASPTPPKGVRVGSDSDDDRRSTPGLSIQSKLKQAGLDSDLEDDEDDDDEDDLEPMDGPAEEGTSARAGPTPSEQIQPATEVRPAKRKAEDAAKDGAKKAKPNEGAAVAQAAESGGGVTEQEIVEFLRASGPIASSQLTARFKRQIKTSEHKTSFTKLVKKVAKLEEVPPGSGNRCIVLKH